MTDPNIRPIRRLDRVELEVETQGVDILSQRRVGQSSHG